MKEIILKSEALRMLVFMLFIFWGGSICVGASIAGFSYATEWWQYLLLILWHIPMLWIKSIHDFANDCI